LISSKPSPSDLDKKLSIFFPFFIASTIQHFVFEQIPSFLPHVQAGTLRAIGVAGDTTRRASRSPRTASNADRNSGRAVVIDRVREQHLHHSPA
jgi:hypothetical protein